MEGEGKADRQREGKTTYRNGQGQSWDKPFERLKQRGMEKSGCPIILDAPTVIQTTA